jgi:type I restriction enzyme M protein
VATDLQHFSRTLFAAADQLWTNSNLRPDQYAQPVLALIALRQMEAKFEVVHAELAPKYKGRLKPVRSSCPRMLASPDYLGCRVLRTSGPS